jgi:hypothetical protein
MDLIYSMLRIPNPRDLDQSKEIRIDQGQDLKLRREKLLPRKLWVITLSKELIL